MDKKNFTWPSFLRALAVIAIPVALQNLLTTTGSMVDTIMLATLGETTIGAFRQKYNVKMGYPVIEWFRNTFHR